MSNIIDFSKAVEDRDIGIEIGNVISDYLILNMVIDLKLSIIKLRKEIQSVNDLLLRSNINHNHRIKTLIALREKYEVSYVRDLNKLNKIGE